MIAPCTPLAPKFTVALKIRKRPRVDVNLYSETHFPLKGLRPHKIKVIKKISFKVIENNISQIAMNSIF